MGRLAFCSAVDSQELIHQAYSLFQRRIVYTFANATLLVLQVASKLSQKIDSGKQWHGCKVARFRGRALRARVSLRPDKILTSESPLLQSLEERAWVRRPIGTFNLLAQKLVFRNSELDKSTTLWARVPPNRGSTCLGSSLSHSWTH
jgi:hypothetical protein